MIKNNQDYHDTYNNELNLYNFYKRSKTVKQILLSIIIFSHLCTIYF